jgi:hypothetical protein
MYNVSLLEIGTMNPPIQWIYANKNEKNKIVKSNYNHNYKKDDIYIIIANKLYWVYSGPGIVSSTLHI